LAITARLALIRATILLRGRAENNASGADESLEAQCISLSTGQHLIIVADTRNLPSSSGSGAKAMALVLFIGLVMGSAYGAYHYRAELQDALFSDQRKATKFVPLPGPNGSNQRIPDASESPQPMLERGTEKETTGEAADLQTTQGSLRTWSDKTGQRKVQAAFVESDAGVIVVRKTDGMLARVPLESLSSADREYVASLQATSPAKVPAQADGGQKFDGPETLEARTWTEKGTGRQVDGIFVESKDESATIQRASGQLAKVPLHNLSDADLRYIRSILKRRALADEVADAQSVACRRRSRFSRANQRHVRRRILMAASF
jgi:hypothetical protein